MFNTFYSMQPANNYAVAWPVTSLVWPLLRRLNKKNGLAFSNAIQGMVQKRTALPKDAKHDLYSIAGDNIETGEYGFKRSELWAEAVFFLPAGEL
jgi:hypothetical protein